MLEYHRRRTGSNLRCLGETEIIPCRERNGKRWHSEQPGLYRSRDGTGIRDIVAEVRSFVDAGHHEPRRLLEEAFDRDIYAVRGCAVNAIHRVLDFFDQERAV